MSDSIPSRADSEDWPLHKEMLIELGRISSVWVSLEFVLNLCIGKLAGFDVVNEPTAHIFTLHSSFPQRLDILGSLCEQLSPAAPNLNRYQSVISEIKEVQKLRNKYIHNSIALDVELGKYQLAQASARGKIKSSIEFVTPDELYQVARRIQAAGTQLYELVIKNGPRPAS